MTRSGCARPAVRAAHASSARRRSADNRLVRAVGRVPVKVRTKLLVAFAVIAALLVVVGVARPARARPVQRSRRVARHATAEGGDVPEPADPGEPAPADAGDPRRRGAESEHVSRRERAGVLGGSSWTLVDKTIAAALSQVGTRDETRRSWVRAAARETRFCSARIRLDYRRFSQSARADHRVRPGRARTSKRTSRS